MPSIFSNPRDVTHSLAPPLFPLAAHLQRLRQLRPEVCHLRWRYARELYVCMCSTNAVDFGQLCFTEGIYWLLIGSGSAGKLLD